MAIKIMWIEGLKKTKNTVSSSLEKRVVK